MKKFKVILLILVLILMVTGCIPKKEPMESIAVENNELIILNDYEIALKLLDEKITDKFNEQNLVIPNEKVDIVKVERISDKYFLCSYFDYPFFPKINLYHIIIDIKAKTVTPIGLEYDKYIEEIYIKDNKVRFVYEGENTFNAFKEFPYEVIYDVEKDELIRKDGFITMEQWSNIRMGNGMNKVGFSKIVEIDREIYFGFREIEGTILAGGDFCPKITIGNTEDGELYIDFENTFLSEENRKALKDLEVKDYIEKVEIREYINVNKGTNTAIYFTLKGVEGYTCRFDDENKMGNKDFVLVLKHSSIK